jgi:hypothetical protein
LYIPNTVSIIWHAWRPSINAKKNLTLQRWDANDMHVKLKKLLSMLKINEVNETNMHDIQSKVELPHNTLQININPIRFLITKTSVEIV